MPADLRGPAVDPFASITIRAWNLLGGLDWAGLPLVADWLGCDDVERLASNLAVIREQNGNR